MVAQDIMVRNLPAVNPTMTVWDALSLMRGADLRHLPVTDDDVCLQGVLSNRDFRRLLDFLDAEGRVSEIMTKVPQVITAHPETPLVNIAQIIAMRRVGCVPIVDARQRRELVHRLTPPLNLGSTTSGESKD